MVGHPLREVGGRQRDRLHAHPRVGQAAELGALAEVDAGVVGLDLPRLVAAGHRVAFAVERGDPERVDDVARRHDEPNVFAGRHHQLARRHEIGLFAVELVDLGVVARGVVAEVVAELPPPLLADDDDGHVFLLDVLVELLQHRQRRHGDDDEDDQRDDRPGDLEFGVAVVLDGPLALDVFVHPEAEPHVQHRTHHEEENGDGDEADRREQAVDAAGVGALGFEGVQLRRRLRHIR